MKKFRILLFALILFALNASSQSKTFESYTYKDYPNGTRIGYFYIVGDINSDEFVFLQEKFVQLKEINRFEVVSTNKKQSYCMIECTQNIDEIFIYQHLTQYDSEYKEVKLPDSTFPKYENTGNPVDDNENYNIAKQKWIKENPEKYKQLTTPRQETSEDIEEKNKKNNL